MIGAHLSSSVAGQSADLKTLLVEVNSGLRVAFVLIKLCEAVTPKNRKSRERRYEIDVGVQSNAAS